MLEWQFVTDPNYRFTSSYKGTRFAIVPVNAVHSEAQCWLDILAEGVIESKYCQSFEDAKEMAEAYVKMLEG